MFYEKELTIDGTKYIRADRAIDYVRELEEKTGEKLLKSPIRNEYRMTQSEYFDISDLFDKDIAEKKFIEIENATIHALSKEQFIKMNKILNCYYDLAYARMDSALNEEAEKYE